MVRWSWWWWWWWWRWRWWWWWWPPVTPRQREVVEVGVEQAEARDHERARRGAAGEDDACGGVVSPEKEKERRVGEQPHDAEGHPSERPHEVGRVLAGKKEQRAAAEDN